jgi:ribosomal protein S18 acetylase RimI-like enzyme
MAKSITIKPATLSHLHGLNELFAQYRQFYSMPSTNQQSLEFLKQRLHNKDSTIFIAFIDDIAVGFVQIYPSFSSVAMKPLWILNDLFVCDKYRRLGVAKKLMLAVEANAKQCDVFAIKLATQTHNSEAKALYDLLGYQVMTQFDHYSKRLE